MTSVEDSADTASRLTEDLPTSDMESFGEVLRRHRVRRGLTQDGAAGLVGVSRATFTQWETDKHFPSVSRGRDLDEALHASGALIAALEDARPQGPRSRPVVSTAPAVPAGPTLATVLKDARRALLGQLCFEDDGQVVGWRHNLVPSNEKPSIASTTYGLRALVLLGGPDAHTPAVVDRMMREGVRADGTITGWRFTVQREPRLEATAPAVASLLRAGAPLKVDKVVEAIGRLLDKTSRERPFILTLAVEPLLRVAPDSALTAEIVRDLLDCRRDFHGTLLWSEKQLERDQPLVDPSVSHTARAITALRDAPAELVGDAVTSAEEWLAEQPNLDGVTEVVRRTFDDAPREELAFHHFTSAWVVQALAGAAKPDFRAINRALRLVWDRYDPSHHLWAWGNGDVPVWMLVDAVAALQSAAFALLSRPDG
jgi:transcriptional regulator with XRE-family HTH domain